MKTANAFDGDDSAVYDRLTRARDCFCASCCDRCVFTWVKQVDLGSAVIAAYGLGIVSARAGVGILIRTCRTHGKFPHTGPHPVIGHRIQYGEPGPACGAVDKRMHIPAVRRVVKLLPAFGTGGNVRRYENIPFFFLTLNNIKLLIRNILTFCHINFQHC